MNRIDELEKEHLENVKNNQPQFDIGKEMKRVEEFRERCVKKLRTAETSDIDLKNERTELNELLEMVQKSNQLKNIFIFNSQHIDFIPNQDEVKTSFLGNIEIQNVREEKLSAKKISLSIPDDLILDLNEFSDGNLCVTCFESFNRFIESTRDYNLSLKFSLFDSTATKIIKSIREASFIYLSKSRDRSLTSLSNGTHVLVSLYLSHLNRQYLFIISNKSQNLYRDSHVVSNHHKTSIDSKRVYLFDSDKKMIVIFDLMAKKLQSIELNQDLHFVFDKNVSTMINNDMLYACNNDEILVYNLSSQKFVRSFSIYITDSLVANQFINNYFVLIYKDRFYSINLDDKKIQLQSFRHLLGIEETDLKIKAINESKLLIVDAFKVEFFIVS